MKIRIKGDSIRFRLGKSEVERFAQTGKLEEKTRFLNGDFTYILEKTQDSELTAKLNGQVITLGMPEEIAAEWTSTERIGFQNEYQTGAGNSLFILIEKDFVCLDNTFEDQSDNYPNPNAHC
ncbi:MAG: hypothetical protein LCH37_09075 [Bacteroidetes bacterium]|nr:hypothetical protein [Bacteroidota bacterium]